MKIVKEHAGFILFMLIASGLYLSTLRTHGMFMWDEAEYASIGRSMLQGEGFSINGNPNSLRPPVLPIAGAVAILVTGSTDDAIVKFPVLLFALAGLTILYIAVRIECGNDIALLAAVLLGLAPSFWEHTSHFLSEIPFLAFFTGAVLFMHHGLYRDERYFKYSWTCFGLAALTRYTAVLFGPILILMLVAAFLLGNGRDMRKKMLSRSFLLSPLFAAGIMAPWLIRQQATFGDALIGFKQASGQLQGYMREVSMPWSFYLQNVPDMLTWVGTIMLLVGILWALKRRAVLSLNCLIVSAFLLIWFSFYRYKEVRLITSILPFLALVAAVGSLQTLKIIWPKVDSRIWVLIVAIVLGTSSYLDTRSYFKNSVALGYPIFLRAAEYIRSVSDEEAVVMGSVGPQLFWYTNRNTVNIPGEEALKETLETVDWVILVNFERGQPNYVVDLTKKFTQGDIESGRLQVFQDNRFSALVFRADLLKSKL